MFHGAFLRNPLLIRLVDSQIVEEVIDDHRILITIDQGLGGGEVGVDENA